MSLFARLLAMGLGLGAVAASSIAYATPTPEELNAARDLFRKGVGLEKEQKYQDAYEAFAKVSEIVQNPNVHYHLGFALYKLNRLAEALNQFERAVVTAGPNPADPDMIAECKKLSDELRERLPRVTVQVPSGVDNIEVKIDEKVVSKTLYGLSFAADPGDHKITATAKGRLPFSKPISLTERGPETSVKIDLPIDPNYKPGDDNAKKDTQLPTTGPSKSPLPWIVGGAGVALLAGGGIMMLMRQQTIDDLNSSCTNGICPASKENVANSGKTYTIVGDILLGVGTAALAGGIIWLVVAPGGKSEEKPANAHVGIGPGSIQFSYQF